MKKSFFIPFGILFALLLYSFIQNPASKTADDCIFRYPNAVNGIITYFSEKNGGYEFRALCPGCGKEGSEYGSRTAITSGNDKRSQRCHNCKKDYYSIVTWADAKCD